MSLEKISLRALYGTNQHQIAATASAVPERSPPPFLASFAEVAVANGIRYALHEDLAIDEGGRPGDWTSDRDQRAPADIANAVHDAAGIWLTKSPVTAERVWQALREKGLP